MSRRMRYTRRGFIGATVAAASVSGAPGVRRASASKASDIGDRVDPWIELDSSAYRHNVGAISKLAEGRPVIAVVKNDAYGLGVCEVSSILDAIPEVWGLAVVRAEDALALRGAGVQKPILLMGRHAASEGEALAREKVTLSAFADDDPERLRRLSESTGEAPMVHVYVDTGLGRMGRPHTRLLPWLDELSGAASIGGAYTMLTSDDDFAREQIRRFREVRGALAARKLGNGVFHAASSSPTLHHPDSRFDAVRPGILLHGSLPAGGPDEAALIDLKVAFRLRARVVRLERLPAGATLGFSRFYRVESPTWIATIPTGWGDGYPSAAENGAVVAAGGRLFEVVNVNSNHANVLVGPDRVLELGDVVTMIGPDDEAVTPEGLARRIDSHNYRQIDLKGYLPKFVS